MSQTKATGRIRLIKTPHGEAPLWVRKAWVDLDELPCDPYLGYPEEGCGCPGPFTPCNVRDAGVLSGKPLRQNIYGVSVPQKEALEILERYNLAAARYWRNHGFPKPPPDNYFGFTADEIEIISGVTHQRLIEVRDEDLGDPYR